MNLSGYFGEFCEAIGLHADKLMPANVASEVAAGHAVGLTVLLAPIQI